MLYVDRIPLAGLCICSKGWCYQSVYLAKKNPLVDGRGGETSVPSELREYTAALPNLIKFLMGSSALNIQC